MQQNPYKLLGVSPLASDEEIKKAYRAKSMECHPDHGGSTDQMAELNAAYKKIDTPEHRKMFDQANSFSTTFNMWETIFGESNVAKNFGEAPTVNKKAKNGTDITVNVNIPLETFIFGSNFMTVSYKKVNECLMCSGTGIAKKCKCAKCGGVGKVHTIKQTDIAKIDRVVQCRICKGTGEQVLAKCDPCEGTGEMVKDASYSFRFKPGTTEMEIVGKGNEGMYDGENGSLILHFSIECPDGISFSDNKLHYRVLVHPEDVVLGAVIDAEICGRMLNLSIPATGVHAGDFTIANLFGSGIEMVVHYDMLPEDISNELVISAYKTLRSTRK